MNILQFNNKNVSPKAGNDPVRVLSAIFQQSTSKTNNTNKN